MIVDKVDRVDRYRGMNRRLDAGFDFIANLKSSELTDGRHAIDGDSVYALVQSYTTGQASEPQFEAHRKYIDIQFILTGRETLFWMPLEGAPSGIEYSEETDAVLYQSTGGSPIGLSDGHFVVLYPEDAHMPGCAWDAPSGVRKVIVKVKV